MSIKSGFFNSVNGDRKYNAEDMSHYFDGLITDGVFEAVDDKLQVKAGGAMTVNVATGRAMIDCHWLKNDSVYSLDIEPADVQLNRCDGIGVKLDLTNRQMSLIVYKGKLGSDAFEIPKNTETIKYLWLATVWVKAGTTSITQSRIGDLRGGSVCPWVTGLIKQVDTSQLFAQYQEACQEYYDEMTAEMNAFFATKQAEFNAWFDTLTSELVVDTYIKKYQNSYIVNSETKELSIGISEYDSAKDILSVNINGVLFVEGVEYTISGTGAAAKIVLNNTIKADNRITFVVLKSKIGSSAEALTVIENRLDEINGEVV